MDPTRRAIHCLHNSKRVGDTFRAPLKCELTGLAHTVILAALDSARLQDGGSGLDGAPHRKTEDRTTRTRLTGLSISMACCIEGSPRFRAVQPKASALARSLGIQSDLQRNSPIYSGYAGK